MGPRVSKPLEMPATKHFHALVDSLPRLEGRVAAVTGCTSGTGLTCAQALGKLGARVVMINRPSDRADAALKLLQDAGSDAVLVGCDLQSFQSVKKTTADLHTACPDGIDILCNNAGVMGLPDIATGDGCDVQMQVNHLSHFLLTAGVWDLLELASKKHGEARVVNHSSGARKKPWMKMTVKYLEKNGGNLGGNFNPMAKWRRYQQSKLANVCFTYALHQRAQEHGSNVKVLVAHPGATLTDLQMKTAASGGNSFVDTMILNSTMKSAHSPEDGTQGIMLCCAKEGVESGQFYGPKGLTGLAELLPEERDADMERVLWDTSLATTGASYWPTASPE